MEHGVGSKGAELQEACEVRVSVQLRRAGRAIWAEHKLLAVGPGTRLALVWQVSRVEDHKSRLFFQKETLVTCRTADGNVFQHFQAALEFCGGGYLTPIPTPV